MKKTIILLLSVLMLVGVTTYVSAVDKSEDPKVSLTERDLKAVQENMEARKVNVWDRNFSNFSAEFLFDSNGEPGYILGITDRGYIILRAETFAFCESGERNPYTGYENAKKYYGGPCAYYVDAVDEASSEDMSCPISDGSNCFIISSLAFSTRSIVYGVIITPLFAIIDVIIAR